MELWATVVVSMSVGEPSSCGAHRSAVSATRTTKTIQTAPMTASLFFLRRFQASLHSVRAGAAASSASAFSREALRASEKAPDCSC